jgi:hypothetical protein
MIEKTLEERGSRYGKFSGHAEITQALKRVMNGTSTELKTQKKVELQLKWANLTDSQREALEMVAHKIGRILNGDPNYDDSWVDIEGYVHLVVQELRGEP